MQAEEQPEEGGAGAPWVTDAVQRSLTWRDGDIVVSVPAKSGTTWTMNIVHQLREGGDREFADVYAEVPWLELVDRPSRTTAELLARYDGMTHARRRAFKSHAAPPKLPYIAPGQGAAVQYVVVVRNPEEAVASMRPFLAKHSQAWFDLWQVPREAFAYPDFDGFFRELVIDKQFYAMFFHFVAQWWPLRDQANVLLLHFGDMKRDHEGTVRRIAEFLGFAPSAEQWPTILECTSFAWMKQHEGKFEAATVAAVPILEPGAMVRKGQVGAAREDGITPAMAEALAARGREILRDEAAFAWLYHGGDLR